jgi:hypothetical protein
VLQIAALEKIFRPKRNKATETGKNGIMRNFTIDIFHQLLIR